MSEPLSPKNTLFVNDNSLAQCGNGIVLFSAAKDFENLLEHQATTWHTHGPFLLHVLCNARNQVSDSAVYEQEDKMVVNLPAMNLIIEHDQQAN